MQPFRSSLFLALALSLFLPCTAFTQTPDYPPPAKVKEAFLKLLDRPKVPLDPKIVSSTERKNGWELDHLSIASEKKADGSIERVPMIVLHPAKSDKKLPAVIVLHGTGGSMKGQLGYMEELAKRNIIGVAIDARYHGDRVGAYKGATGYVDAITKAWRTKAGEPMEHPFYYDTCWDLWRTVDYLATRDDVDAKRLGMIGFSMGGIETWLAASADDRVKVAIPAIGVQSFRWSLENEKWQGRANTINGAHLAAAKDLGEPKVNQKVCRELWSKVLPGILDRFDCPSMLRLFAGRELMILNGTKDGNCPIEGARIAIASAEKAFKDAGTSDHLSVIVEEVGHTVTPRQRQASLDWFERWLK